MTSQFRKGNVRVAGLRVDDYNGGSRIMGSINALRSNPLQ